MLLIQPIRSMHYQLKLRSTDSDFINFNLIFWTSVPSEKRMKSVLVSYPAQISGSLDPEISRFHHLQKVLRKMSHYY